MRVVDRVISLAKSNTEYNIHNNRHCDFIPKDATDNEIIGNRCPMQYGYYGMTPDCWEHGIANCDKCWNRSVEECVDINGQIIVSCKDIEEVRIVLDYLRTKGIKTFNAEDFLDEDGNLLDYFIGSNICIHIGFWKYFGCDREDLYIKNKRFKEYSLITFDEFVNATGITK